MRPGLASFVAATARLSVGANVRRIDFAPDARPRIYFANHASHLDTVVLWAALPKPVRLLTRPVAAKDYWGRPGLRRYLACNVFNAILIEREKERRIEDPIEVIAREMGERYSIIIFPEGTRGNGEEIAPFKGGIYYLAAKRPDIELIPVYLENLNRVLPKGEVVPIPLLASLSFGAPIRLEHGESKDTFLTRTREALKRLKES